MASPSPVSIPRYVGAAFVAQFSTSLAAGLIGDDLPGASPPEQEGGAMLVSTISSTGVVNALGRNQYD
jgi:hypothetical protein